MTRPYSEDIRERALARADAGETVRSIAEALQISPSLCDEVEESEAGDCHSNHDFKGRLAFFLSIFRINQRSNRRKRWLDVMVFSVEIELMVAIGYRAAPRCPR
jgi:hypothetical protein